MVIDDSSTLRQVVSTILTNAGYEVEHASNGQDALDKLKGQKIHLFICDVFMPEMDGISFLKEKQSLEEYKFTPVIMLTTEKGEDRKSEGRALGAKAWMVKPFSSDALLAAVQKLILP